MTTNRVKQMRVYKSSGRQQQGFVLVVGMIFLLVLTIIGVSLMTGTTQDEKLSGNSRRSSDAFMASEGGVYAVKGMFEDFYEGEDYNPPLWFYYSCKDEDGDDNYDLIDPDGNVVALGTELIAEAHGGGGSAFSVTLDDEDGDVCQPKMLDGVSLEALESFKLISTGVQTNSNRVIHFNMGHGGNVGGGDASWPAVFVNDNPDDPRCDFDFGPSNAYLYDGKGGPALSTNSQQCAEDIRDADTSDGQLVGGVIANNPNPDFTSPEGLRKFYAALQGSDRTQNVYPTPPGKEGDAPDPVDLRSAKNSEGEDVDLGVAGDMNDPDDYSDMEAVIVHGDVSMSGSVDGAGVLIITGTAKFGGTPNWDGVIIVLGGSVDIGGGGTTNGLRGTMLVSNIDVHADGSDYWYCSQYGVCQEERDSPSDGKKYADTDSYAPSPYIEFCDAAGNCSLTKDATHTIPKPASWDYGGSPEIAWDVSGGGTARYNYGCDYLMKVGRFLVDDDDVGIDPAVSFPAPSECPDSLGEGEGDDDGLDGFGPLHVYNWLEQVNG